MSGIITPGPGKGVTALIDPEIRDEFPESGPAALPDVEPQSNREQSELPLHPQADRKLVELWEFRGRLIWFFFIGVLFVLVGALMVSDPSSVQSNSVAGLLGAAFFGLCSFWALSRLYHTRCATAILTSSGMMCPSAFEGSLPWGMVQSFEYFTYGKSRTLYVKPYADVVEDIHWRGLTSFLIFLRGPNSARIAIPLNSTPEDEARFLDVFIGRLAAAKAAHPEGSNRRLIDTEQAERAEQAQLHAIKTEATASFPYVTLGLTILLVFVLFAEIGSTDDPTGKSMSPSMEALVNHGALFSAAIEQGEWRRILAAPLLHANFKHLLMNCVALWIVGTRFERYVGSGWFAAIFGFSAIAGSFMSLAVNPENVVSVGASGGILGLFAATALASRHFPPGPIRTLMMTAALETLIPALIPLTLTVGGGKIDYGAHLGGALGGGALGFALLMLWPHTSSRPRYRKLAGTIGGLYLISGFLAVCVGVPEPPPTRQGALTRINYVLVGNASRHVSGGNAQATRLII